MWINRITEIEDENDIRRAETNAAVEDICKQHELDPPCTLKHYTEIRSQKLQDFRKKRFKEITLEPMEEVTVDDGMDAELAEANAKMVAVATHLVSVGATIEKLHCLVDDLNSLRENVVGCFPNTIMKGELDSKARKIELEFFQAYHSHIFDFLLALANEKGMLTEAPRSIVKYIDFIENYYWRMEDQLYLEADNDLLQPNLRSHVGRPLKEFYLKGMLEKFIEFAEVIVNQDFKKGKDYKPEDGILRSAAPQDIFNIIWQNVDTIDEIAEAQFLVEGYMRIGMCLEEYIKAVERKLVYVPTGDEVKDQNYKFAVLTINNSDTFCKHSDDFLLKALASVSSEYHEQITKDGEAGDIDDIGTKFKDAEAKAVGVLVEAAVKGSLTHMKSLFKDGKWYPSKKKKEPVIVKMLDDMNIILKEIKADHISQPRP